MVGVYTGGPWDERGLMAAASFGIARWRLIALGLLLAAATIGIVLRLAQLQLFDYMEYRAEAQISHEGRQSVQAQRGTIRDRNGFPLAVSVPVYQVALHPKAWATSEAAGRVRQIVAERLSVPLERLEAATAPGRWVVVQPNVPYNIGRGLGALALPGVETTLVSMRTYPEGNLAAPLLGFVGADQEGLSGLEADFQRELAGMAGALAFERDGFGQPIPIGDHKLLRLYEAGQDLVLTLDRYLQRLVERTLDEAMTKHKASGGTIIMMDPRTGEVLAMASRPTYDLTKLDLVSTAPQQVAQYRNRAITDLYEPGSVFKIITMASAIDGGIVTPSTTYYDGGPIVRYGWTINTWNGGHYGTQTMTDILRTSNNIGAVWVAERAGADRFYRYVRAFGFGQPTGIGLSGEASGRIRASGEDDWKPIDLATNSFGQGLSVTPIQMAAAISAVANGGTLLRPTIVKELRGAQGSRAFQPVLVRRPLTEKGAALLQEMLNVTAEKGGSPLAMVPGYHIAGKTGTADLPAVGGYNRSTTIASYGGFAPYPNPRLVVLVKINEPKDQIYGSLVAAPIFSSLMRQALPYLGIPPSEPVRIAKQ